MKVFIFSCLIFLTSGLELNAQASSNALGIRLAGDGDVNGAEISYQKALAASNRLELDLGFKTGKRHERMYLAGIYQWHWNIQGGLNWYAGPGAVAGLYTYDDEEGYINIGLGVQVGIEFNFISVGAPILMSIDARPMWDFIGDNSGLGWGAALGIRYVW